MVEPVSDRQSTFEVVPLGGLGEFGMNTMAVSSGDTTLLLDAGVMFPGSGSFGVDMMVPDLSHLRVSERRLAAVVLTHGHEDHVGGVPYVWDLLDGPVYGTALTLGLLEPKLEEHGIVPGDQLVTVAAGESVSVGPLDVEFLQVAHSMPDCTAIAVHTPVGTIVHTGDFKFDNTPLDGRTVDTNRLAALGDSGVVALFADSTNAERPGFTGSEQDVLPAFDEIFARTAGKLIVATFSSSLHRIQLLINLAARFHRKVALVGRGLKQNAAVAVRLGQLRIPAGTQVDESDVSTHDGRDIICLVTGSQGEPFAALSRIAVGHHRHIALERDDVVVFSARAIPGNQRSIGRLMDHVARRGAEIIHDGDHPVHVSGHASSEDLGLMLSLVKPRYFVPIHGEYRYLASHARLVRSATEGHTDVFLMENGDRLCFDAAGAWRGDSVPTGRVLIDGTRTGEVADEVLRDRRRLATDGVVVLVAAIDQRAGGLVGQPTVTTRGFVNDLSDDVLAADIATILDRVLRSTDSEERTDLGVIEERIRIELQRFFRRRSGRRPLVIPVVVEI